VNAEPVGANAHQLGAQDPRYSLMEVATMIYELRVYQPVPGQVPKLAALLHECLEP
jgi:hypothetical protein